MSSDFPEPRQPIPERPSRRTKKRPGRQVRQRWERLAAMVASGELPIPDNLPPGKRDWLLRQVDRQRRARLVSFIARAIAQDIGELRNT